ncbi:hypothetical protein A33M_2962 [Rhodovulum sp. PH10]|uniref:DUF6766 family protein n=1 Tax=Rhodovulum sp. PH10 TaxID=1187851 RepID=UPI00027C2C37|nr:DUF6766 family protein [Rhodovulum sp. PH10]EJW11603.1 hypothetical protein A33M_2962 [Rhodovulum sp. PH10]
MKTVRDVVRDNSLSLAFCGLFVVCLVGQIVAGYLLQAEHPGGQLHASSIGQLVTSASFLEGVFGNWQAALFQLLVLILLAVFLRQRGASHSKKTHEQTVDRRARSLHWFGRHESWAYRNSLSLAFASLFVIAFVGFFFAELIEYNDERLRHGEAALDAGAFLLSAKLWFELFQTWQAEFFAMGTFLLLSIVLRQQGSAESKPVESSDDETGETNE